MAAFGKAPAAALAAALLWQLGSPAAAADPSFPCSGTLKPAASVVCSDESLAALDRALAAAYAKKLNSLPADTDNALDETRAGLIFTQKAWLIHRNECGSDKACIRQAYRVRTGALTAPENAKDVSCRDTVGAKQAAIYVKECLQLKSETHPPCNADNSCELIISRDIYRCNWLGDQAPKFCRAYAKPD